MNIETIKYYAKGVAAVIGSLLALINLLISALDDRSISGDEWGQIIGGVVLFIGTVTAVIKLRNGPKPV